MKKKTKNIIISAALICALCFGVSGAATLQSVAAETVSVTALVGTTTDNVTVSDSTSGLELIRTDATLAWSVQLNSLFTGTTEITYRMTGRPEANWVIQANAFTVKDFYGEEVARFIIGNKHWNVISDEGGGFTKAFLYNPSTGAYTTAAVTDGVAGGYTSVSQRAMTDDWYFETDIPDFYPSPASGSMEETPGTVTFAYADGKMTVSTSTFDLENVNDDNKNKVGNGQTVAVGEVKVNLDQGYTITVGSASGLTLEDGTSFSYPYSSNIIISDINGCDTTKALTTNEKTGDIVYYSAKSQESGNSVISLNYGAWLNKFYYVEQTKCIDENGNELYVSPSKVAFDYADNKSFTANEDVTVSYGGKNKGYTVQTNGLPEIATNSLVNVSDGVTLTTASSVNWTDSNGETQTQKGLLVSGSSNKSAWNAELNGVFTGSTSLSYFLMSLNHETNNAYTASAFTIKQTDGTKIADFVVLRNHWAFISTTGAYVYDAINKKYMTQNVVWKNGGPQFTGDVTELNRVASDTSTGHGFASLASDTDDIIYMYVSPTFSTSDMNTIKNDNMYGTVLFSYENNTLTIKTTTYDVGGHEGKTGENFTGQGQTITIGEIAGVDLSGGYTISMGSAPNVPYTDEGEFAYPANSPILLVKINGQDVTGETVQTTEATENMRLHTIGF